MKNIAYHKELLIIIFSTILIINASTLLPSATAQNLYGQLIENLYYRIKTAGIPPKLYVQEEPFYASLMLSLFYLRRDYNLAWSDYNGPLPQAYSLIKTIHNASFEGLDPEDYHISIIEEIFNKIIDNDNKGWTQDSNNLIDLDLLLTDAFLIYSSHLLGGRIDPRSIDPMWNDEEKRYDLAQILQDSLDSNSVEETLYSFLPNDLGYMKLRDTLKKYQEIAAKGGWPILPEKLELYNKDLWKKTKNTEQIYKISNTKEKSNRRRPLLRGIMGNEIIRLLQEHLISTGDLDSVIIDFDYDDSQDNPLKEAIKKFQRRHGLLEDGIIGHTTLNAMNVPVEDRIHQIKINMERCRWFSHDFEKKYILVNIANFKLSVIENNEETLSLKAIVGKPSRPTPVFNDTMAYMVFNPYWTVPPTIAKEDIIPAVQRDPDYLYKKQLKVFQKQIGTNKVTEINPKTINWKKINEKNCSYTFRRDPGETNPLGQVKFIFPNKYSVYIHDTPSRSLFNKTERCFSSGCVRIENPIKLSNYLLASDQKWSEERISDTIKKGKWTIVKLPEPVPVHLVYLTTWVDKDGSVYFRNDIYGRDKPIYKAFSESSPDISNINREWAQSILMQQTSYNSVLDLFNNLEQDKTAFLNINFQNPYSS